jgi:YrbI family 3-deoxy-D-manno-octulosonate 8-phosphate phosphatase
MSLIPLCQPIELILTDVDGVLTDGRVVLDDHGVETKQFHVRDGQGIRLWQQVGGQVGIVTGRSSQVVLSRAAELDIEIVHQDVKDKLPVVEALCEELNLALSQICYVGDDLPDVPVLRAVGMGVAVADAVEEAHAVANYITSVRGGHGAIREVVELVLKNTGRWEEAIRKYVEAPCSNA